MNKMSTEKLALVIALTGFALASTGCPSTVRINSDPPGASVTVNGQHVGTTPTAYTDTAIVFSTRHVQLDLEGYQTLHTTISRSGSINVGAALGGFFCLWPLWLWAMDYPDHVNFQLQPIRTMHGKAEEEEPDSEEDEQAEQIPIAALKAGS